MSADNSILTRGARRMLAAACLAVLAIASLFWSRSPAEPACKGHALREWLRGFDAPIDAQSYVRAREAILEMGTNVLPHLEPYLRSKDWHYRAKFISIQRKLHLLREPVDYDFEWHRRAAC